MKSTDKFVLVLVTSLALLLAGCGGGSSSTTGPVDPGPTPAETAIMNAEAELTTAQDALSMLGASATDAEKEAAFRAVQQAANNLVMALKANGGTAAEVEAATTARQNAMNMADYLAQKIEDDAMAADAAMMATAAKLYAGISAAYLSPGTPGADVRAAAYNVDGDFRVNAGLTPDPNDALIVTLSQDKEAMVASHRGWEGMKLTASTTGTGAGTYEAVVYSNVGEPTQGAKFNSGTGAGNVGFETTAGVLTLASDTNLATRISSPSFDHSAGTKTFHLPDPNTNGATIITIAGSYYGVDGTYACNPGTDANGCTVTRAANGYTLDVGTDAWTFKATNPDARVTEMPDTNYVSYGWWIYKSADGSEFRASAFRDVKGTVNSASSLDALNGTATYVGGAVGKYALSSPIGGTNDAGHFTARATLEATFTTNTATNAVTGTIDNFIGADGEARDWSVELKGSTIQDTGVMSHATFNGTVWTIGGTAAAASGEWDGRLYDNGNDGVPKVAVGTFYSTYGPDGKIVGAFGANLEE